MIPHSHPQNPNPRSGKRSICPGVASWLGRPATAFHQSEDSSERCGELAAVAVSTYQHLGPVTNATTPETLIATEVQNYALCLWPNRCFRGSFKRLQHAGHRRCLRYCVLISLGCLWVLFPLDSQAIARRAVNGFGLLLKERTVRSHLACHVGQASFDPPCATGDQDAVALPSLINYGEWIHEPGDSFARQRVFHLGCSNGREPI